MQAQATSTSYTRRSTPKGAAEQRPYCPLPRRMLSDLRDNGLAIGLYLLVARLYLVSHAPILLSRADVRAFDPSIKTGAVKRAFDRLTMGGWLVASSMADSAKHHYTPAWGSIGGAVRPWSLQAPALGRPRHLEMIRVNRDLLDVGLGRLDPHPRHAAAISRYLVAPSLSLADLGAYALVAAGLGRATPALTVLGLVEGDTVCALPPALLQHFVRHSGVELSEHGRRKLERASTTGQGQIGRPIGGVIGQLIGSPPEREEVFCPPGRAERPQHQPRPTIPGIVRDSSDSTPPPTPPAAGGGQQKLRKRQAGTPTPNATPVPETDATRLLRTIDVRPAQQIELAGMSLRVVEAAIADGRTRQGFATWPAGWCMCYAKGVIMAGRHRRLHYALMRPRHWGRTLHNGQPSKLWGE
jgi:hypothetical protein